MNVVVRLWRGGGRRAALLGGIAALGAAAGVALCTLAGLQPPPATLRVGDVADLGADDAGWRGVQLLDRRGEPLNTTFTSRWNVHDVVALHEVPAFLRAAFVAAEDKRFYEHHGPDWSARLSAALLNVRNGRAIRGASTISEQVVRLLHPRPRTLWSRWLEGFEARELERRFTKDEILEFYLNQVPYAANRHGVQQAASYYFARDVGTLSRKEMLALAVLVRAPTRFDLLRDARASEGAVERLADALVVAGALPAAERGAVLAEPLALEAPQLAVAAPHFVQHARARLLASNTAVAAKVATTLDARLQATVQRLLDERLRHLERQRVGNGAVLVADHATGEVLAWVVAGGGDAEGPASYIDAVTTPRQPGSALKPFLYALALDGGWTAAETIVDEPLVESTSEGLHAYQNYSRRFYGPVALRDALGNSLNIPAVKTLQHVGTERYLGTLHALGFEGLTNHPDFYGDGLALGSGGVTLLELVQAYAALANGGVFRPLSVLRGEAGAVAARRVYSAEAASLVANILADPNARALEFGRDSVLRLPVQTAVKTGTSSDYRDAWAVGFDWRYAVGVWMGNLDQTPSDGITGSTGPALVLRSVFAELTRDEATEPLYLSPRLARHAVCVPSPLRRDADACLPRDEWFVPGTEPRAGARKAAPAPIRFSRPTPGLRLAYDPRLPAEAQQFEFALQGVGAADRVVWEVDGRGTGAGAATYRWPVTKGDHRVAAQVWRGDALLADLRPVEFVVK
ncbi:MAG TPA: transglycosylase domain-containing protein [Gammaproteobacteria bacterium]|nr:transglycosylase domain-containing protein [Gammaproteobacteria bacterium]